MRKTISVLSIFVMCFLCSVGGYAQSSDSKIVAGKGSGKVILGASQAEIEETLGKAEEIINPTLSPGDSAAIYSAKGLVVVYERATMRVKLLRFIGDGKLYGSRQTFQSFQGSPDKNIAWGASVAEVVKAYGEPLKRESYNSYGTNVEVTNLYYSNAHFILKGGKLFQINIMPDTSKKT